MAGRPPPSADSDYYIRNNNPALLESRVFIGNLPTLQMDKKNLEDMFKKYGKILAVSLHKGFGFAQFEREKDAREAVEGEKGKVLHGYRIDVKMAAEGRRSNKEREEPPLKRMALPRDRSPPPERRDTYRRDSPDDGYRRPPPHPDDRYPPPPRADPYRRERDPYVGDRRHSFEDPYAPAPVPFVPPFDCTIVSMSKNQRDYAEIVERKVRAVGLETDFIILSDESMLAKAMDDITLQKIPFAVVCAAQNEAHRSLTVNILHGTPQEHRNMPVDDAVALLVRNFDKFKEDMRAKMAPPISMRPKPPAPTPAANFVAPHPQLAYLMHLVADGREVTLDELDQIFTYIQTRRNREREARGLPTEKPAPVEAPAPVKPKQSEQEKTILEQQAQLQAKILSILQGPSNTTPIAASSSVAAANNFAQQVARSTPAAIAATHLQPPRASSAGINFDNPSVQRALDNLIQSGPNLLRNIGSTSDPEVNSGGHYGAPGGYRY